MAENETIFETIGNQFLRQLNPKNWIGNTGVDFFEGARVDDTTERRPYSAVDIDRMLNIWTWRELLIGGRHLFQNFPIITGACKEKSAFAIGPGWIPVFMGKDQGWGEEAEAIMDDWFAVCDLRGQPYNFWYSFWIASLGLEHSGDDFILHTEDDFGNPRLLFLEAHHVGQKFVGNIMPDGPYKGRKVSNGIIYDENGICPVAYNYIADFWSSEIPIDATYMSHIYEPNWFSQGRGIPSLSHSMSDWDSVKQIRDSEKLNVASGSRINMLDYDATGTIDTGAQHVRKTSDGQGGFKYKEVITKGEIRHIMAGTGRKLEAFVANRPGTNTMAFIDHMMKGGFMGMEWPMEFGYMAGKGMTGPAIRALTGKVQKTVSRRQRSLAPAVTRAFLYGLSVKMQRQKQIKFNPEWMKWDFLLPAEVSIDGGRDDAADLKEYETGLSNGKIYCGRKGQQWRKVYRQRAIEADYKQELLTEFPRISMADLGGIAAQDAKAVTTDAPLPEEEPGKDEGAQGDNK